MQKDRPSQPPSAATSSPRSGSDPAGWKRILFPALLVLVVLLATEALSYLLLFAAAGHRVTRAELEEELLRVAQEQKEPEAGEVRRDSAVPSNLGDYALHPYLGYVMDRRFRPDERRARGGEEAIEFGFSRMGPELFAEPEPGRLVVGVTGGSVANGCTRMASDQLVESILAEAGESWDRVVVVSFSVPAYKQPQQLMALNYLLALGAHFDVVVNIDGFNDITLASTQNLPKGVFPFYPGMWYFHVADLDPRARKWAGEVSYLRSSRRDSARWLSRRGWRWSLTAMLIWSRYDRWVEGRIAQRQQELLTAREGSAQGHQVTGPHRRYAGRDEMLDDLARVWAECSLLMHQVTRARGIRYYHVLQPNQYFPGSKTLAPYERKIAYRPDNPWGALIPDGYPRLVKAGRDLSRRGVGFMNLTNLFRSVRGAIYVDGCCHYNERGYRMMASRIGRRIGVDLRRKELRRER